MSRILKPQKQNFAKSTNYMLTLGILPEVEFWVTTCNIPTLSVNDVSIANPVHGRINIPSNTFVYAPFICTFMVDEDYSNYSSLLELLQMGAGPEPGMRKPIKDLKFDASLHILTNNKNANDDVIFTFHGMLLNMIGEIPLNNENPEPVVTDATFSIDWMTVDSANPRNFT